MNAPDRAPFAEGNDSTAADLLLPLLQAADAKPAPMPGPVVGELLAIAGDGTAPLVRFPGQPTPAAVAARSTVDLHGAHVGGQVLLVFEGGDVAKPIVVGVLRDASRTGVVDAPGAAGVVEVQADGERLLVQAKEQLVLRCGKASITLTRAGKVLIEGGYVLSRSTGVNRVKGGSVQLN